MAPRRAESDRIVALQRTVGNRAVAKLASRPDAAPGTLMRAPRTEEPAPDARAIPVTFIPAEKMGPDRLAVFVLQQLYGESESAARARLAQWKAHGGKRQGASLTTDGITDAMVSARKPFTVWVIPPRPTRGQRAEMRVHEDDLAAASTDERARINAETDKRFWLRVGDPSHAMLVADEEGERELWMSTREQLMQERDRVLSLPEPVLDFIEAGDEYLDPANYAAAVRIADKAKGFTEADWARYERNVIGTTSDWKAVEAAVGRFAATLANERRTADRLKGTEPLFELWHKPSDYPVFGLKEAQAEQWLGSHQVGFTTIDEYNTACEACLDVFQNRAVEIALLALRASYRIVTAELERYKDPTGVATVYGDLADMRTIVDSYRNERAAETDPDVVEFDNPPSDLELHCRASTEAERGRQARRHPILADDELSIEQLAEHDQQALGASLRKDAAERLRSIEHASKWLQSDHDAVFQFPRVVEATKTEMGIEPGSIHAMIVDEHMKHIQADKALWQIAGALIAIGLTVLTFGTGTVAVLAAGAMLAQSVYTGAEEVTAYGDAYAAAHSAFDSSKTLSADSPSAFWAAFALMAAGLEGVNLINSLKAATNALHVLEQTQSLADFDAQMLSDLERLSDDLKKALTPEVRAILKRAMKARKRLDKLTQVLRRQLGAGRKLSPRQLRKAAAAVSKSGYHGAQLGMKDFDEFLTLLQAGQFQPIEFGKFSAEEMAVLEEAWEAGVAKAEKAGVAIKPGSASKTAETDEWAEDTDVDLDPAGAKVEEPLAVPVYGFTTKSEVKAAVLAALQESKLDLPRSWDLVKKALGASRRSANRELAASVDAVMAALSDPTHWAEVLAEAWERVAKLKSPNIREALIEMATQRIGKPIETRALLKGKDFFKKYVVTGRPIIDEALKGTGHGELTHLIQDLVIDRALGTGASARFRRLLKRAKGSVNRDSEFGKTANQVFLDDEQTIKTGDYVWRFTGDLFYEKDALRRLPQPEAVGPKLFRVFGLLL